MCTSPAFQTPLLISWDHLLLLRSQTSTSSQTVPAGFRPLFLCGLVVSAYKGTPILQPLPFWPQLIEPMHLLMLDLLPAHLSISQYEDRDSALRVWKQDLPPKMPVPAPTSSQKASDRPLRSDIQFDTILTPCSRC